MRISAYSSYTNPSFTSSIREVAVPQKTSESKSAVKHRNTTYFYRSDMDWNELSRYLANKYKKTNKVNTYCYACSDGSEPYSFVMKMINDHGDAFAEKFFPVQAKDYDSFIISKAKSQNVMLNSFEPKLIDGQIRGNMNVYMDYVSEKRTPYNIEYLYHVKDKLFNKINFSQADIVADVATVKPDNSVVFCRNFWPYLKDETKITDLAKKLYNQLGENSCVILGDFDQSDERVFKAMKKAGFKLVDEYMRIFEKVKPVVAAPKPRFGFVRMLFL